MEGRIKVLGQAVSRQVFSTGWKVLRFAASWMAQPGSCEGERVRVSAQTEEQVALQMLGTAVALPDIQESIQFFIFIFFQSTCYQHGPTLSSYLFPAAKGYK